MKPKRKKFKRLTGKPVTQFNSKGKPIAYYSSITEASEEIGIDNRGISLAAHGKLHMFRGYFWRFGKYDKPLALYKITHRKPTVVIHNFLRERLGIKKITPGKIPSYLNLSTKSMKGERWNDVPGYKGLYKVSSFGRVKALQKITFGKQQKWRPEHIQRAIVDFRVRKTGKPYVGIVWVCMAKEGSKTLVAVARWVYYLFVKKFDIANRAIRVAYKDGDTLNMHYRNLVLKDKYK